MSMFLEQKSSLYVAIFMCYCGTVSQTRMCLSKPRINNMLFWWRTPMLSKISWFWETKSRLSPLFNLFKALPLQLTTVSKLALWLSLVKTSAVKVPFLDQHPHWGWHKYYDLSKFTVIGQPSSLPIPPDSDQQSRFVSNRLQVIPPTARSFVHSFPVSRTLPWTFVLMKSQGGQVSRWSSVKDWVQGH